MSAPATDFAPTPTAADTTAAQLAFEHAEVATNPRAAADQFLRAADEAESAREWLLAAEAGERAADLLVRSDPPRAARLYQRAAVAYERCGHFAARRRMITTESGLKLWRGPNWG